MVHPVVGDPRLRQSIPPDPHSGGPKATPVHPPSGLKYEAKKKPGREMSCEESVEILLDFEFFTDLRPQIRISDLGSRISDLGSRISDHGSRISDLGSRISDHRSRSSALGSRILDLGSRISDLGSRSSALGSRISDLGSRIMSSPTFVFTMSNHRPSNSFKSSESMKQI
jgi:hypothetical protein